jgi:Mg-chelatase subunit ChlD
MERKLINLSVMLLAFSVGITFAGISFFRQMEPVVVEEPLAEQPGESGQTLEMVFVLDTTGSMGGLLEGAKQKIWSIVNDVMQKRSKPRVKIGLVAYRDIGDDYVTRIVPLTDDLDAVYSSLMELNAGGGGDTPENVQRALAEGVRKAGWSASANGKAQVVFLVGDAPPKNYQNEPDVISVAAEAVKRNMTVNTIQCGDDAATRTSWQQIARAGQGSYFAIAQDGGVEQIASPFDDRISELGRRLGGTYMSYGAPEKRSAGVAKMAAAESTAANTNMAVQADRALNKGLNPVAYMDDLLQDLEAGKARLRDIKTEHLPEPLQKMSEAEREKEVEKRMAERRKIREEILSLSKQRDDFIRQARARSGKGGGFDAAVSSALAEQLAKRGIR